MQSDLSGLLARFKISWREIMSEDEIKAALSIEFDFESNACGTDFHVVKLLWNGEAISRDEVEIND